MTSATSAKLRLGPLPKTETIKLTITLNSELKTDLDRYAALHAQTFGIAVDAATLIPHMLDTFISKDRAFRKAALRQAASDHQAAHVR